MLITVCDECGTQKSVKPIYLATGYIYINEEYRGQCGDLCKIHYPRKGEMQPNNCKKVRFHWPKLYR